MKGRGDSLDFRQWRNLASWFAGIGVEVLVPLALVGIAALVLAVFRLFGG